MWQWLRYLCDKMLERRKVKRIEAEIIAEDIQRCIARNRYRDMDFDEEAPARGSWIDNSKILVPREPYTWR